MSDSQSDSEGFLNEIIGHGSIVLFGRVAQLGIKFAVTVLLARYLGQTGFGSISLALSVLMIGSTLSMVGLNSGVARFLPRYEKIEDKAKITSTAGIIVLTCSILISLAIYLGTFVFGFGIRSEDLEIIRVLIVGIPLFSSIKLIWGIFQGEKLSSNYTLTRQIFLPIVRLLLSAIAAIVGLGVLGLAVAQVITYSLVLIVGVFLLFRDSRELVLESILFDFSKSKELLMFSSPLVLAGAMNMVMSHTDTILIGVLSTTSGVGIYNTVYPLAMLMFIVQSSIGFIFLPSLSQQDMHGNVEETKEDYLFLVLLIIVLTFPAYFVVIYQPYLTLETIFGRQYTDGSLALVILSTGFYIRAILGPNNQALKAIGETKTIMYLDMASALTNVVLNVVLIPYYGFLGAAIATAVTYLLAGSLYSTFLFRNTGIHPISNKTLSVCAFSLVAPYFARGIFTKAGVYDSILWTVIIVGGSTLCYVFFLQITGVFKMQDLIIDYLEIN